MKRFAWAFLLLAFAAQAHASGVALRWGSCQGQSNRNFACDKSTGSELLVGSFDPPSGLSNFLGIEVVLRLSSANGAVPSWWQMYASGTCRRTSVSASFDMSDQFECDDAWSGQGGGGLGKWESDGTGINVWIVAAVPQPAIGPIASGRSYAAFKLIINHQKSNGPGACGGCDTPMCIKLESIRLTNRGRLVDANSHKYDDKYFDLTDGVSGMGGASQVATWQGGTPNCAAAASRVSTWSDLKKRFKPK